MPLTSEEFMEEARLVTSQRDLFKIALERRNAEYAQLEEELRKCQAGNPPNPPDPAKYLFVGACPESEGGNMPQVVSKYGANRTSGRYFTNSGLSVVAPRPSGLTKLHASCKPALGSTVTPALIRNFTKNFVENDIFTVQHETPTKIRDGRYTPAQGDQALKLMNDCHKIIDDERTKGNIPFFYDAFVDAAWMWDTTNNKNPLYPGNNSDPRTAMWWGTRVECDLVGNDLDAYAGDKKYPDFKSTIDNCIAFAGTYKFLGWTVPEFIHFTIPSDPTGTGRAAWINSTLDYLNGHMTPPHAVMLFDRNWLARVQEIVPGSPEFKVVQSWQPVLT